MSSWDSSLSSGSEMTSGVSGRQIERGNTENDSINNREGIVWWLYYVGIPLLFLLFIALIIVRWVYVCDMQSDMQSAREDSVKEQKHALDSQMKELKQNQSSELANLKRVNQANQGELRSLRKKLLAIEEYGSDAFDHEAHEQDPAKAGQPMEEMHLTKGEKKQEEKKQAIVNGRKDNWVGFCSVLYGCAGIGTYAHMCGCWKEGKVPELAHTMFGVMFWLAFGVLTLAFFYALFEHRDNLSSVLCPCIGGH